MTLNSKIPGISLIQDTSEWFSVVERTKKSIQQCHFHKS
jgi:hypothetical protein